MNWGDFAREVREAGFTPRRCHADTHWQILAPPDVRVDFWPHSKKGRKYRVIGGGKARHGGLDDALQAARIEVLKRAQAIQLQQNQSARLPESTKEGPCDKPEWWEDRARIINAAMELMDAKSRDLARLSLVAVLVSLIALGVSAAAFIEAIVGKG